MERRNRSLEALESLTYVDSLDDHQRAPALLRWMSKYIANENISDCINLEQDSLKKLSELFYKNINFLKTYREKIKQQLDQGEQIKKFIA